MSSLSAASADNYYRDADGVGKETRNKTRKPASTIRFELPFDGICCQCGARSSKGSRFNAQKSKVGHYLSSPIFAFKMTCSHCSAVFVVKTNPRESTYEYSENLRKQVHEPDDEQAKERSRHPRSALERLERDVEDVTNEGRRRRQLEALLELQDRSADDWNANSALRAVARGKKRSLAQSFEEGNRLGLAIPLVEENGADLREARRVFRPLS